MNNIESNFVPYQIAVDMKSIEFDEPCFGYYQQEWHDDGITQLEASLQMIVSKQHQHAFQLCSAPTYSAAFRWFREKYNHVGFIQIVEPEYGGEYGYVIYYNPNHLSVHHWNKGFKTYEEAEQACLDKLIEIIKEKT